MAALLLGLPPRQTREAMPNIQEFSGIGDAFDDPVWTYSNGMRARLGFATSYYAAPDVVLIDEVLGVGDQEFRDKSANAIREMVESDRTVVFASHNITTVQTLAHSVIWLENGTIKEHGEPAKVCADYQERIQSKGPSGPRAQDDSNRIEA